MARRLIPTLPNTVEENGITLRQLQNLQQVDVDREHDLNKLFAKFNATNEAGLSETVGHSNSPWRSKDVINFIYGPIPGFNPGAWWGIRMDCSRDRVHDPFISDVHQGPVGVTSVCTSSENTKHDVDFGEFLTLTGLPYSEESATDPLTLNYKHQVPLRLIRSYNLSNNFAPKTGYRYDGLYIVIAQWVGASANGTKYHKFALKRLANQEFSPRYITKSVSNDVHVNCATKGKQNNLCSSCTYDLRKRSNISIRHCNDPNATGQNEREKDVPDSTIVTRQVFKKSECNGESVNVQSSSSTSEQCFGHQEPMKSNTNISIRTDLYESSHNVQQENKKGLMLCCRNFKQLCVSKRSLLQKNIPRHVNTLFNYKKQSSISKTLPVDCFYKKEPSGSTRSIFQKDQKVDGLYKKLPEKGTDLNDSSAPRECDENKSIDECIEKSADVCSGCTRVSEQKRETDTKRPTENQSNDSVVNPIIKAATQIARESPGPSLEQSSSIHSQESKALESLHSLTPDKILNLINAKKYHPVSKLLIRNMIGYVPDESVTLRGYDNTSQKIGAKESMKKRLQSGKEIVTRNRYACRKLRKYTRSEKARCEKLSNKSPAKGNIASFKRARRRVINNILNAKVKRNLKAKSEDKSNGCSYPNDRALTNANQMDVAQEVKVTKDASAGKHYAKSSVKRRRKIREIANLLIDAKVSPIVRGPRNRRLRHINNICNKQQCDPLCAAIYSPKKSKVAKRKQQRKSVFQSANLNKMFNKNVKCTVASSDGTSNINDTNNNARDSSSKSTPVNGSGKSARDLSTRLSAVSKAGRSFACDDDRVAKPRKTDATTQCSILRESTDGSSTRTASRTEGSDSNERDYANDDEQSFVKLEYNELDAEDFEGFAASLKSRASREDDAENGCQPEHRTSAFAPVNVLDSDMRIARLRSIGFRPIATHGNPFDTVAAGSSSHACDPGSSSGASTSRKSKVVKRDVAEEFNKYSNEENDVVVYMDEELQYQDIEDEDAQGSAKEAASSAIEDAGVSRASSGQTKARKVKATHRSLFADEDFELPWHGWKKIVTGKKSFWIGW